MTYQFMLVEKANHVATITLNRPEKRNALHAPLIQEIISALSLLAHDDETRVLILRGNGDHFCAGGDIAWMQHIASASPDENYKDAQILADLLFQLYSFPKPTMVLAHGATVGGGLGILSACDIAIAAQGASFALPEVKLGITPSMISPYVIAAIGERAAHYYFLTGEKFQEEEALRLGLIHRVCALDALNSVGAMLAQTLLKNSPAALKSAKQLIRHVAHEKVNEALSQKTAEHLANLRATAEGQEGLHAFLEKREPNWTINTFKRRDSI